MFMASFARDSFWPSRHHVPRDGLRNAISSYWSCRSICVTDREISEAIMLGSVAAAGTNMAWAAEVFRKQLGRRAWTA